MQFRSARQRLHTKVLAFNTLIWLLCGALLWLSRGAELRESERLALTGANLTERSITAGLDKVDIALSALQDQSVRRIGDRARPTGSPWFVGPATLRRLPEVHRFTTFDAQGDQVCGIPADPCLHLNVADRDYFRHFRDQTTPNEEPGRLFGPYPNRIDGRPSLILARPLGLAGGRFGGVVIAVIPLEGYRAVLSIPHLGEGGAISLRTQDLRLLVRHPELTRADTGASGRQVSEALLKAVAQTPSRGTVRGVSPVDNQERLSVYVKLDHHPLYVLAGLSVHEALASWRHQCLGVAGMLLILGLGSWALERATTRSLERQERVRQLYDEAPCGYHTLDEHGHYLSVNATELSWLGCSREEALGRLGPDEFFTPESRQAYRERVAGLGPAGRIDGLEVDLLGRDGTLRHLILSAHSVGSAHGSWRISNTVMHDISPLHQARRQLRELAAEQGVMLDNDLIGIVKLRDRRIVWKNRAMDLIYGYRGAEWDDMPTRQLYLDEETHRRIGEESWQAMSQGKTYRRQLAMRRQDGSALWIDSSATLLSPETGEVMLLLADISALKAPPQTIQ